MIARVYIHIPFNIQMVKGEQFPSFSLDLDPGYKIDFYPPFCDSKFCSSTEPVKLTIDGKEAFSANCIHVDFKKDEYDRHEREGNDPGFYDPSIPLIKKALSSFLIRFRYVTQTPHIHSTSLKFDLFTIRYLNDDGTELKQEKGKVRGKSGSLNKFTYLPLNQDIWEKVSSLKSDFKIPIWNDLLLDAKDELPEIGPSIVLASSALEVFISTILNQCATEDKIPPKLWRWINNRSEEGGHWIQNPSLLDQFDILLLTITGHSLKEDDNLWKEFKKLKNVRNNFIHGGIASESKRPVKRITEERAQELIQSTQKIILKIRDWLPTEVQWQIFTYHPSVCNALFVKPIHIVDTIN